MNSLHLVVDESGAKGYSDNNELESGEFGVMAGFVIPSVRLAEIRKDLDKLAANYAENGKLHITDLSRDSQESLRNEVFGFLKARNAYWFYEAIYVQGFHDNYQKTQSLAKKAKESAQSDVKISQNEKKDLLHSKLFLGVFGKGLAFGCDNLGYKLKVNVITDNIDKPILSAFKESADKLLNVGKPSKTTITGFDPNIQKVVSRQIQMRIIDEHNLMGDFTGIEYEITCEDTSLTLVADILANSAHYYIKQKLKEGNLISLNSDKAIEKHPLANLVFGSSSGFEGIYIPDAVYKHPLGK